MHSIEDHKEEGPKEKEFSYLVLTPAKNKGSHHTLGSRYTLLGQQRHLGITLDLENGPKRFHVFGELVGKDEIHEGL